MRERRRNFILLGLILGGLLLALVIWVVVKRPSPQLTSSIPATPTNRVRPSSTPEPIIPTRTPTPERMAGITATPTTAVSGQTAAPRLTVTKPAPPVGTIPLLARFGSSGSLIDKELALAAGLPLGSFYAWKVFSETLSTPEMTVWQTIRVTENGIKFTWEGVADAVAANPSSIWVVGNEPDVIWQDNVTPERYAAIYHEVYTFVKALDPTAQIAIGAVSQPTPLRLAYLDLVLDSYQEMFGHPMPIDIWTVHTYVLREEKGSWGVDIPPGMDGETGRLYEIEDHGDVEIFKQNIIDFRAWMDTRGYREYPLAVTEFGILMPSDYGFPPEKVGEFMVEVLEFFLTAENDTGYPLDNNRLVQYWFWYSLYDEVGTYHNSDLYDRDKKQLTLIGRVWADFYNDYQ